MASLLIADDHPLFRAALRQAARDALGQVELFEAGSLDAVLALLDGSARQSEWIEYPHYWVLSYILS